MAAPMYELFRKEIFKKSDEISKKDHQIFKRDMFFASFNKELDEKINKFQEDEVVILLTELKKTYMKMGEEVYGNR